MGPIQSLPELMGFLRRRFDLLLVATGIGAILAAFIALQTAPVFQSHTVLSARLNTVSGEFATTAGVQNAPARLLQLVEQRLTTRENMLALADKYDLFAGLPVHERVDAMRESVTFLSHEAVTIGFARDGVLSSIIVQARADEGPKAANIANELASMIIAETGAGREARARETLSFLHERHNQTEENLREVAAEMRAFSALHPDAMPFSVELRRAELLQLTTAIQSTESDIVVLESELAAQNSQGSTQRRLALLRDQLVTRQAELARLQSRRDELEPFFTRVAQIERDMAMIEQREERLQDSLREIADQIVDAETNLRLETGQQIAAFEILEPATAAEYPISRSRKMTMLMGVFGAAVLAVVAAFGYELLRPALRSAGQVERETGMRPVLVLPELVLPAQRRRLLTARFAGLALFMLTLAAVLSPLIQT
ncbi:hypothetical protein [Roseinatronobacter alkalisoli]|uniref:Polysaccharide chain length determinant N-terminal domain-containing protein n=1 Tax=Roseinatronobacter alkalisoli TaxID=3028235 RepID=A0ABT5T9Y5_9RHOB|nr:hypothetical protein [Roseinatronobacter sp. HJB301]MDD7971540.1 hypothetical protein [Roseinatronobacter sp. HJB301]